MTANERSPVSSAFVELDDKREEKWSDDERVVGIYNIKGIELVRPRTPPFTFLGVCIQLEAAPW